MELRHLYTRTITSWPLHKHTTIFPTNTVNTIEKYPMSKERKIKINSKLVWRLPSIVQK
jgi:hypothetical protein